MNIATPARLIEATRPLDGKVALITGSTSGIGLGIARALAAQGSAIVLNGFGKPDEIEGTTKNLISDFNVRAFHSAADMSKAESIEEMISTTFTRYGRLDILVNNAGIQHVAPVQEFLVSKWDA